MFKSIKLMLSITVVLVLISCKNIDVHSDSDQLSHDQLGQNQTRDCQTNDVVISKRFEAGRFSTCRVVSENHIELTLVPENLPINASPWYAFKVASTSASTIDITLIYQHHKHRYWPKISKDLRSWTRLSEQNITVDDDKKRVKLSLNLDGKPLWITAQPLRNNAFYDNWLKKYDGVSDTLKLREIGKSGQGRALVELSYYAGDLYPTIVLLGTLRT